MIKVRRISEGVVLDFEVVVHEGEGGTRHHVTMSREMCERLTAGKYTPERCLEAAFRFLLDREPKESILGRFDVTVISRYLLAPPTPSTASSSPRSQLGYVQGRHLV